MRYPVELTKRTRRTRWGTKMIRRTKMKYHVELTKRSRRLTSFV
jgi:hypothetical protein